MVGRSSPSKTDPHSEVGVSNGLELELLVSLRESVVNSGHGSEVELLLSKSVVETAARGGLEPTVVAFALSEDIASQNSATDATCEIPSKWPPVNIPLSQAPILINAVVRELMASGGESSTGGDGRKETRGMWK